MTLTLEELKKHEEIGHRIHKRVHAILEFHSDRFLEYDFVWAGHNKERGTDVYAPPLEIESWYVWLKGKYQDKNEVHVEWGSPNSNYRLDDHYTTFPIEWITDDKLHQQKIKDFKTQHDEMQLRVDKRYKKKEKKEEYKKKLEKELDEERDKKIKDFEKAQKE